MWRTRTKLLRWVVVFLAGCAILGFIMGVKGALPRGGAGPADLGPPAAPTSGVVVEATPLDETLPPPPAESEKAEAKPAEEEKTEEAKAPEKKAAEPKPAPVPPEPKEEPPPADPVGDLIDAPAPPPDAVIY